MDDVNGNPPKAQNLEQLMAGKYRHGEAFALMWYACTCGHRERIWNSRDGVTPFGLGCPSCGSPTLRHVDWQRDQCTPSHQLHRGQRYFRDGTAAEASVIVERRIASARNIPAEVAALLRKEATEQTGEFVKGWPVVARHE